ncbi:hypothetical protein [Roseovarius albus]|uniref:hypothetical protein n=1 Tax=Roseovarius albus TaxID=1247867 RepID=UPI000A270E3C|nr:hypothetical protein [Roseovarius albus]
MTSDEQGQEVLAVLQASPARRGFGVGAMGLLGFLLIYVALSRPPQNILGLAFLLVIGAGGLWLARAMWLATAQYLVLTKTELRSSSGELLARVEDIAGIERGMFAFKPSSGFTLKLKVPAARRWQPGLWWRLGAKLGVGGMTSRGQAKAMADTISATKDQVSQSPPNRYSPHHPN